MRSMNKKNDQRKKKEKELKRKDPFRLGKQEVQTGKKLKKKKKRKKKPSRHKHYIIIK